MSLDLFSVTHTKLQHQAMCSHQKPSPICHLRSINELEQQICQLHKLVHIRQALNKISIQIRDLFNWLNHNQNVDIQRIYKNEMKAKCIVKGSSSDLII